MNQHNFSPEAASKASSLKTYLKTPHKSDSVLSFFKESGFSNAHIEDLFRKAPAFLGANVERSIKPKIKIFQDLGFSPADVVEIISKDPWIMKRSVESLTQGISVLKTILNSDDDVCKLLKASVRFLKSDLEKTMIPNIQLLRDCGVDLPQIVRYMFMSHRLFTYRPEKMRDLVERADKLGVARHSLLLAAIRTLSSMTEENWEKKLMVFRSHGFSQDDILEIFRKMPSALATSKGKVKDVIELMRTATGDVDNSLLVRNPSILVCSVEDRLKPRLHIFRLLTSKKLLPKRTSLSRFLKLPKTEFIERYVVPYSDHLGQVL